MLLIECIFENYPFPKHMCHIYFGTPGAVFVPDCICCRQVKFDISRSFIWLWGSIIVPAADIANKNEPSNKFFKPVYIVAFLTDYGARYSPTGIRYIDGSVQDCSTSIANALEFILSYTKPWILSCVYSGNARLAIISRWVHTWPCFNIKMSPYQYRKSHFGDKTVVRSSYFHNGISYTGKLSSLYWIGAQVEYTSNVKPA